jgi:antitoxin component YwqK of YwqJK toxin-antitoxin module
MVGRASIVARVLAGIAGVLFVAQGFAAAHKDELLHASSGCRAGRPQGPYQLRDDSGQLRVAGAFNDGTRTGSFIFWRANGVREAHVPYDNGVRNGTVATWYDGPAGREPPRHVESAWRHGRRDGQTRSWYPDGRLRSLTDYAGGRIVASAGWDATGEPLTKADAREQALRDERDADAEYARRDALIREHMPGCGRA